MVQWQLEMTGERLRALAVQLEWVLQRQNRRFADATPTGRMSIERRRLLLLVLALAIALLLAVEVMMSPRPVAGSWHFVLGAFVSASAVLAAMIMPAMRAWSVRTAGRMLQRRAARMLAPLARHVPYTAVYELDAARITWRIEKMRVQRAVALADVKRVLYTGELVALFRRRYALTPFRIVYVPAADVRGVLIEALAGAGAECDEITGATEGYVAPVPEARAL